MIMVDIVVSIMMGDNDEICNKRSQLPFKSGKET